MLVVIAAAWLGWSAMQPGNAYAERDAGVESAEAGEALEVLRQLARSTNHLKNCMSGQAAPMARLEVLREAERMARANSMELASATWKGDYLAIGVDCAVGEGGPASHHFYFKPGGDGKLELVGVHR